MNKSIISVITRTTAAVALIVTSMFWVTGCEWLDYSLSSDIQQATGVNPNDPKDVIGVAAGGMSGNQEQQDAILKKKFMMVKHSYNGYEYAQKRQYTLAKTEYHAALQWAETETTTGKDMVANIYNKIGDIFECERIEAYQPVSPFNAAANNLSNKALADGYKLAAAKGRRAADNYNRAADEAPEGSADFYRAKRDSANKEAESMEQLAKEWAAK
jgi:hypothetical protein